MRNAIFLILGLDKVADRIAGALVDLAYKKERNPRVAVEVLIGHGKCHIINETSVKLNLKDVVAAVKRISGIEDVDYVEVPQDEHLAHNQDHKLRCGDNGIFKGVVTSKEEDALSSFARDLYVALPFDGKFVLANNCLIVCQSHFDWDKCEKGILYEIVGRNIKTPIDFQVNPLGYWEGGTDVDTGATNRKLGSDMGRAVTGGGLHGKDLSKADVSVNIYAYLKAQKENKDCEFFCAIGDEYIDGLPYAAIVEIARDYVDHLGGFEKLAEWGLV